MTTSTDRHNLRAGLEKAMEIVGDMRQSEAGMLDEKHSGQRGCDRSDALYDAYVAIRAALTSSAGPQPITAEQAEDLTRRAT